MHVQETDKNYRVACDECHRRKRACSKDLNGCSRCLANQLQCIYSPKRPMGRPSLRAHEPCSAEGRRIISSKDIDRFQTTAGIPAQDSPSVCLIDLEVDPLGFALPSDEVFFTSDPLQAQNSTVVLENGEGMAGGDAASSTPAVHLKLAGLDIMDKVTFDNMSPRQRNRLLDTELSTTASSPRSESLASFSSPPSHLDTSGATCICLSKLFKGFELLTRKVTDPVDEAIQQVRTASHHLHDVLHCTQCDLTLNIDAAERSTRQSSWAVQLVCTNITAIINAYAVALELVQAHYAGADGRPLRFHLSDLGGLWGELSVENDRCTFSYDDHQMPPHMWRTMMRALLRADLQGFDIIREDEATGKRSYHHPGIVDHLDRMERKCWELMNNAQGNWDASGEERAEAGIEVGQVEGFHAIDMARSAFARISLS